MKNSRESKQREGGREGGREERRDGRYGREREREEGCSSTLTMTLYTQH